MRAFAFLSNYLLKSCYLIEKKESIQKIEKRLTIAIELLKKQHPPSVELEVSSSLLEEYKNYKFDKKLIPKQFLDLKNIAKEKRVTELQQFIAKRVEESRNIYPIFVDLLK